MSIINPDRKSLDPALVFQFNWRIKIPCISQGASASCVWIHTDSFGIDEDDAFKAVANRFPNAIAVCPKGADDTKLVLPPPQAICILAETPTENSICRLCGQKPSDHPVMTGTPAGGAAIAFQRYLDGMEFGGENWYG